MLDLMKLFEDWYDDKRITPERLKAFAINNKDRMSAQNGGGQYTAMINATNTAINTLDNSITIKGSETSDREGTTYTKKTARINFQDFLSQKEGTIKGIFGKPSQAYEEFFPQGIEAYRRATDEEFKNMADTAVLKAVKYQAQLGLQFVTDITGFRDAYVNAKTAQSVDIGDVSDARIDELTARHDLEIQLMANVYTIGLNNLNGPAEEIATTFLISRCCSINNINIILKGR